MLVGYIGARTLTCTDVHDLAETNGWLGRATVVADNRLDVYRDIFDDRAGTPQVILLDRQMHVRVHHTSWDPAGDPAFYLANIEALLAE